MTVQSTSTQPTPVSGQGSGSGKRGRSARLRKQMEPYSLTTRQQKQTPKTRKTKARTAKGVKASGTEGTKSGLAPGAGRGRGLTRLLPTIKPKPESVQLPDHSESSGPEEEDEGGTQPPSLSNQEDKSDQFALSPVISPQGTSTPGDVTTSSPHRSLTLLSCHGIRPPCPRTLYRAALPLLSRRRLLINR